MASGKHKAKYTKVSVELSSGPLTLYAGSKVTSALKEIIKDMTLYHGVRLAQVMEAVYEQGLKDGRKEIIEAQDKIKQHANYLPPGRPRTKKKKK